MKSFLNTLKASGRAALVAVALGATAVVAVPAPAMAQAPSFNFQFGGEGFSFGFGTGGARVQRACLSWNAVRRGLAREGWRDIELVGQTSRRFDVEAVWYGDWRLYSMRVHRCTGEVTNVRRLRSVAPPPRGPRGGPSLGLQLYFGN